MRFKYVILIPTVLIVGFGVKLMFFSGPTAVAKVNAVQSSSTDVPKMHVDKTRPPYRELPIEKIHDMTFVFSDGD
jgi:hypothetical protein